MASQSLPNPDLAQHIAHVARKARLWLVVLGISAVAVGFLSAALICGALDYLIRFNEPAWRLVLSMAGPVAALSAGWLFLWPALRAPVTERETAKRLERIFPVLRGRLSNALEFLRVRDEDPQAGSGELRRGVVEQTTKVASQLPLADAIDARLPKMTAALAATCFAALAAFALAAPQTLSLGAKRLASPWGDDEWPRRHQLKFVDPVERIAAGDDVEFAVVDKNGRLPSDLRLQFRLGKGDVQSVAMTAIETGRAAARINNVSQSLVYRAIGGDDLDGPWRKVEAVAPVRVSSLEVTVYPPAYTSLPPRRSTASIRAVRGTRVELTGAANQSLSSATLVLDGPRASETIELGLSANRRKFFTPENGESDEAAVSGPVLPEFDGRTWLVRESGSWRLRLVNRQGIGLGADRERREQGELQALPDEPPSIAIHGSENHENEASGALGSDVASAIAAVNGQLPVTAIVTDDFGLASVRLEYRIVASALATSSEKAPAERADDQADALVGAIELFQGPRPALPFETGQELLIDHAWDLSEIAHLQPGQTILWKLAAEDYLGQPAVSSEQSAVILSEDEIELRLQASRKRLLASLHDALRGQRDARAQAVDLPTSEVESEASDSAAVSTLAALAAAELAQRAVGQRVVDVFDEADRLRDEHERHRLANGEPIIRLESLSQSLDALLAGELANAEAGLSQLLREADLAEALPPKNAKAAIVAEQDSAIAMLERQIAELESWAAQHRLSRELAEMRQDQSGLLDDTSRLRLEALSADGSADESQAAESSRLADEQTDVSRRFNKLQSRLEELGGESPSGADPSDSQLQVAALEAARRAGLDELLRSAAAALQERRLGEAEGLQKQALAAIDEMLSQSGQSRPSSSQNQPSQQQPFDETLAEFAERLTATIDEQKQLIASAESAASPQDDLAGQEMNLARRTRDLAIPFNEAEAILFAIHSAAEAMNRAAEDWRRGPALAGLGAAKAALDRLEQLRVSLEAVSTDPNAPSGDGGEAASGSPGDAPESNPTSGRKFLLAQLKFLLVAQQSLSQRTGEIGSNPAAPPEALAGIATEIAAEQETLARLIESLAQQIQEAPEEGK